MFCTAARRVFAAFPLWFHAKLLAASLCYCTSRRCGIEGNSILGTLMLCSLPIALSAKLSKFFGQKSIVEKEHVPFHSIVPDCVDRAAVVCQALKIAFTTPYAADPVVAICLRLLILANILQDRMELSDRALPYLRQSPHLENVMDKFFVAVGHVIRSSKVPSPLLDILDCNLFRHILMQLTHQQKHQDRLSKLLELSITTLAHCEIQWREIVSATPPHWDMEFNHHTVVADWMSTGQTMQSTISAGPASGTSASTLQKLCSCSHATSTKRVVTPLKTVPDSWESLADEQESAHPIVECNPSIPNDYVLFPIHCPIIDRVYSKPLPHLAEDDPQVVAILDAASQFKEIYHWHSLRKLSEPAWKRKPTKFAEKKKIELAKRLQLYTESLVGIRQPRTIVSTEHQHQTKRSTTADAIATANQRKLLQEREETMIRTFQSRLEKLQSLSSSESLPELLHSARNLHSFIVDNFVDPRQYLQDLLRMLTAKVEIFSKNFTPFLHALLFRLSSDLARLQSLSGPITAFDVESQLRYCGDMMRWREPIVAPEKKADDIWNYGFVPETWQRNMIAAIDSRKSLLVCAPTSSGKTFIAFYVIESLLRDDENAVIVFVVPTKALVNQVYAEISGSYRKTYKHKNHCLVGLFTGDNRMNVDTCSVLVTVPQALEILLLSPSQAAWVSRMKYLILDEAHGISESGSGAVWEHILSLSKCPFLALSATIGNADNFLNWLRAMRKDPTIELIQHAERATYQRIAVFGTTPPAIADVNVVAMATTQTLEHGITQEWRLLPEQTLELYSALTAAFAPLPPAEPATVTVLASLTFLKRYALLVMMCLSLCPRPGELHRLSTSQLAALLFASTKDSLSEDELASILSYLPSHLPGIVAAILPLLSPAVLFSGITEVLKNDVALYDNLLRRFVEAARRLPALYTGLEALRAPAKEAVSRCDPDKLHRHIPALVSALRSNGMLPAIVFSFDRNLCDTFCDSAASTSSECDDNEINHAMQRIQDHSKFVSSKLLSCLSRRMGVHHAGCSDEYKMEVERLFRLKKLDIIFATGTLAQGIHMPCRTVVIAGASPYLTSVSVRQIAGRAGRRGFDLRGNVVFFGINYATIRRLLLAPLPQIYGSLPISTTYVLRLMMHVNGQSQGSAVESVLRQLQQPLFAFGESRELFQIQLQHHLRFSLEFLLRHGHLSPSGIPLNWAGMLTHLHYEEPNNFIIVKWVREGLLHELVTSSSNPLTVNRALVQLLSSLFVQVRMSGLSREPGISRLILEELPTKFANSIKDHNQSVMQLFRHYVRSFINASALHLKMEPLPLSGITPPAAGKSDHEPLLERLAALRHPFLSRSVYFALAGLGSDEYKSPEELVSTARSEVLLDISLLPIVRIPTKLNSFLLDFFKHGQAKTIERENMIRMGDFVRNCDAFMKIIKKLLTAMKEQAPSEDDPLVLAMENLKQTFQDVYHPEWKWKPARRMLRVEDTVEERLSGTQKRPSY